MDNSVLIGFPIENVVEAEEEPSLTYRLDLDSKRIIGKTNGIEAVRQAIRKAIITPRFRCLIYNDQYGSEIKETILAKNITREYIEAAIPGLVEDALKPDSRVIKVHDFSFDYLADGVYIEFTADTIFGEIEIKEAL